jgi:hypothetical protein
MSDMMAMATRTSIRVVPRRVVLLIAVITAPVWST